MTHAAILAADVCKEMVGKPWENRGESLNNVLKNRCSSSLFGLKLAL
jgi:hypothetical protein